MDFEGVVLQVLPEQSIKTQKGTDFIKQDVIFEQPGEFQRKACVTFTGERTRMAAQLTPGQKVRVSFNIESREWNGKWFTEIRGWKIDPAIAPQPQPSQPYPASQPAPQANVPGYPSYANQSMEGVGVKNDSQPNLNELDDIPF